MSYKIIADLTVVIHLLWILFMLAGFIIALGGFFNKKLFECARFRTLHLLGIIFVSITTATWRYCPLTILENTLRAKYDPSLVYPGSFIIHYFEKFIYPDINPIIIRTATTSVAVFSIIIFIIRPPAKIKQLLLRKK